MSKDEPKREREERLDAGAGPGRSAEVSPAATDWREWAGKAAPGTVFDQPEPEN